MTGQTPHVNPNISNIQQQHQQQRPAQASPQIATAQAYEKRSKPADRLATARMDDLLPANSPFFELLQWERQLDSHILAKQMRVADAAFKGPKVKRQLRVSVYNLAHDQPSSKGKPANSGPYAVFATDNNDGDLLQVASPVFANPSWTLRIEGKLEARAGRPSTNGSKKFSSFLSSIIVQIGDSDVVEWKRSASPSGSDFDGFEVKRRGDKNVRVKIIVELDNQPERFKLSPQLSALLCNEQNSTKPHIVMALWRYVKLNKLQESDEKKVINCDKHLRDLFRVDKCSFSDLPVLITPHLSPLDPIEIEYEVVVDNGPISFCPFVYESEVEIEDNTRMSRTLLSSPNLYNIQMDLDSATVRLRELAESLRATLHNQRLLSDFSSDPVNFIRKTYQVQCEDINAILGSVKVNVGDLFRAERYHTDDVEAAVMDMVYGVSEVSLQSRQ